MRQFNFGLAVLVTLILVGCGGSSDVADKPKFTAQVSFGDSLSDVGTYRVGAVAGLGGGQFTINAAPTVPVTPTNWTEMTALKLGLTACAAETGLDDGSGGPPSATYVPVVDYPACTSYAQGGSRVTSQPGIGNYLLGGGGFALTVPVHDQITNHLARLATPNAPGKFTGHEIVFVMAGANDVFYQLGLVNASAITPTAAGIAVATAATELANDINTLILANGAKYVVVVSIPDIISTPFGATLPTPTQGFVDTMVTTFNSTLQTGLAGNANVLFVDAYTASHDEVANPGKYLLTNVTVPACDLTNPLASSLACNASNLNLTYDASLTPGSHYLFADTVHPTPYGQSLFALYVLQAMTNKGWY